MDYHLLGTDPSRCSGCTFIGFGFMIGGIGGPKMAKKKATKKTAKKTAKKTTKKAAKKK